MNYSVSTKSMLSIDENGTHSLEVSYSDSNGANVGAYSEGDNFDSVLSDVLDQIDEALADQDDARADLEEINQLKAQIDELTGRLNELEARNTELEGKNSKYKKYQNLEEVALNKFSKSVSTDDIWKHWFR